jgi:8-hydroxy-5-deazaflavin:NADPH oxidoreductase
VKVGILGSGDVAQALGRGFLKHGHAVMMGTREPSKLADWVRGDPNFRVGQLGEAAQFGELVVLGSAAAEALRTAGAANFAGKTVVDVPIRSQMTRRSTESTPISQVGGVADGAPSA